MTKPKAYTGILGLGARSTEFYVHQLNTSYYRHKGAYQTFPFILYQIDFNEINPHLPCDIKHLMPKLERYFGELGKLPIKKLLIPNITIHETIDRLDHIFDLIHPINLTIDYLKRNNIKAITIFGSKYTMNSDYLTSKLREQNIDVIVPSGDDQIDIDEIRKLVYSHQEHQDNIKTLQNLIETYSKHSIVVLACTELSIIYHMLLDNNFKVLDMASLQIKNTIA